MYVKGLIQRVEEAERKEKLWLYRFKRRLAMPEDKRARLENRYNRYLLYRLKNRKTETTNVAWYDRFRRLQIEIRNFNRGIV